MAEAMTKLTRNQFIPFIDTSGTGGKTPSWKQIDYSTIFSLNPNPQTETMAYICYETDVEEVGSYRPELPQEISLYEGNPVYDFVFEQFYNLPVGSAIQHAVLICFGGAGKKAWMVPKCTLVLGELNTVEGKLSFTLKLGGDIQRGTYAVTDGAPAFTAAS